MSFDTFYDHVIVPSSGSSLSDLFDVNENSHMQLGSLDNLPSRSIYENNRECVVGGALEDSNVDNTEKLSSVISTIPRTFDLVSELSDLTSLIKGYEYEEPTNYIDYKQIQNLSYTVMHEDVFDRKPFYSPKETISLLENETRVEPSHDQDGAKKCDFKEPFRLKIVQVKKLGRVFKPRPKGSKRIIEIKRDFSYDHLDVPTLIDESPELRNDAKNSPWVGWAETYSRKLVRLLNDDENKICNIKRTRYVRHNLEAIVKHMHIDVIYEKNSNFDISRPYEPQYIRYIIDLDSSPVLPFNHTRCGLCPYCPAISFYDIKTSAYAQHLSLQHGIYTDNFLTPNPLYYGHYRIKKPENRSRKEKRKTQAHELQRDGIVCPCCYEIVGVNCSKKTANTKPLTNYMRHFRDNHIYCKDKSDPYKYFNKYEK
ncbi:uncharacterized protein PRCAT00005627001 [Priceomyces carsonii]|uniref:uncharacterized protein n=1 Tax=Priceomyces carsonii TaxID=28549 RepID=UPI002ED90034|nr:unnamed protein product [Priceomyces carsonii]